ncbi:MAG: hypothetical protein AAFY46_06765 [Planctomycetota bacterium]
MNDQSNTNAVRSDGWRHDRGFDEETLRHILACLPKSCWPPADTGVTVQAHSEIERLADVWIAVASLAHRIAELERASGIKPVFGCGYNPTAVLALVAELCSGTGRPAEHVEASTPELRSAASELGTAEAAEHEAEQDEPGEADRDVTPVGEWTDQARARRMPSLPKLPKARLSEIADTVAKTAESIGAEISGAAKVLIAVTVAGLDGLTTRELELVTCDKRAAVYRGLYERGVAGRFVQLNRRRVGDLGRSGYIWCLREFVKGRDIRLDSERRPRGK